MPRKREAFEKLFEIATAQQGYFTYKQALSVGYLPSSTIFHVKAGNWIKEKVRGIYRLAQFPPQDRPDLVLWSLWSANRKGEVQGVYSHETALSIYELTDVMPAKFHMTVSRRFRRNSLMPPNIELHRADIKPQDIRKMQGYLVTTPAKTIMDMLDVETMHSQDIIEALNQAAKTGLVTQEEASQIRAHGQFNDH